MRRRSTSHDLVRVVLLAAGIGAAGCGPARRLALEPLPPRDDDRYDIPEPKPLVRDDYYDLLDYSFFKQFEQAADMPRNFRKLAGKPKQALNVTPLDEVQDSSWFTNRIGVRRLSAEELRRGPNAAQGPDLKHDWTIVAGKTQGVTPGFTIKDARGDRFVGPTVPDIQVDQIAAKPGRSGMAANPFPQDRSGLLVATKELKR